MVANRQITEHPGNDTTIPDAFWMTGGRNDVWETGIGIIWITAGNYKAQEPSQVQTQEVSPVEFPRVVTHSIKHQGTPAHLPSRCCASARTV